MILKLYEDASSYNKNLAKKRIQPPMYPAQLSIWRDRPDILDIYRHSIKHLLITSLPPYL